MPKYILPKGSISFLGWVLISAVTALVLYGLWEAPILLALAPLIAIFTYFDNKRVKKKFESLASEREKESICEFSRSFNCKKVDTWVIRAVYEQIQEYVSLSKVSVPLRADDDLFDLLEIDEEDLDLDLLEEISQRTGRSMKNTEKNPYYEKVHTLGDLVYFVNEQPLVKCT